MILPGKQIGVCPPADPRFWLMIVDSRASHEGQSAEHMGYVLERVSIDGEQIGVAGGLDGAARARSFAEWWPAAA